jgi:sugar O-acyltransferase (sialic acid O-acetyltransferase NeuD family)
VKFVLFAASSSHASELAETAARLGWEIAAAVRNLPDAIVPEEVTPVRDVATLEPALLELPFAVPQTRPANRRAAVAAARAAGLSAMATLVDPTAVLAATARLGAGCYVGAGSVVAAGAVAREGALINRSCSIGHHVVLGEYVSTGPGVVVSGGCRVDDGAFLGAGATLTREIRVGPGAVVGAGAVVIRDVDAGTVVAGNPARVLRQT